MVRIAYLDHSYHRRTASTAFLANVLVRNGHQVDWFWDESWQGGPSVAWSDIQCYDVVIMFQSACAPPERYYRHAHPNVIYIPMLDQFGFWLKANFNLSTFWEPFQGSKVLNFSNSLHHVTEAFGIYSHFVRYFQPIEDAHTHEGLHGFFWLRRENQIPWATIRTLIGGTRFDSFHVHIVPDPGSPRPIPPTTTCILQNRITVSTWFEDKSTLTKLIDQANVYFAPRPGEGIGQSFLEGMARGKCIVAPDQGTMNEYIIHGVNGLLYELEAPRELDFTRVPELGRAAHITAREGYERWKLAEKELLEFILTPSSEFYNGRYQHPGLSVIQETTPVVENAIQAPESAWSRYRRKWGKFWFNKRI